MTMEKRGIVNEETPQPEKPKGCASGQCGCQTKQAADRQQDSLTNRMSEAAEKRADANRK